MCHHGLVSMSLTDFVLGTFKAVLRAWIWINENSIYHQLCQSHRGNIPSEFVIGASKAPLDALICCRPRRLVLILVPLLCSHFRPSLLSLKRGRIPNRMTILSTTTAQSSILSTFLLKSVCVARATVVSISTRIRYPLIL